MHWYWIGYWSTFTLLMAASLTFPWIKKYREALSNSLLEDSIEGEFLEWFGEKLEDGFDEFGEALGFAGGYALFCFVVNGFAIAIASFFWVIVLPFLIISVIVYGVIGKNRGKSQKKKKKQTREERMTRDIRTITYKNIPPPPKKKTKVNGEWEIQEHDNPAHLVGCRITLYDEPNNRSEHVNVININKKSGEFQVKYDDGLKEWIPIDIVAEMARIKFTG